MKADTNVYGLQTFGLSSILQAIGAGDLIIAGESMHGNSDMLHTAIIDIVGIKQGKETACVVHYGSCKNESRELLWLRSRLSPMDWMLGAITEGELHWFFKTALRIENAPLIMLKINSFCLSALEEMISNLVLNKDIKVIVVCVSPETAQSAWRAKDSDIFKYYKELASKHGVALVIVLRDVEYDRYDFMRYMNLFGNIGMYADIILYMKASRENYNCEAIKNRDFRGGAAFFELLS